MPAVGATVDTGSDFNPAGSSTLTSSPEPTPTKNGWHIVKFGDGSVGVVEWLNGAWAWGSLAGDVPNSPIVSIEYLGATIKGFTENSAGIARWTTDMGKLPTATATALIAVLDHGNLGLKGQPVLFDASAKPLGNSGQTGSEANPAPIVPTAGDIASGLGITWPPIFSLLGSMAFWKGVGLVLAGVLILTFAAFELLKSSGGGGRVVRGAAKLAAA